MQRDISWSWRPMSAILPRSTTRIASASTSVDSRCETMISVRPSAICARFWRMIASLSGSSALVASSKMSSRRIGEERARNREALLLAAGEVRAILFQHGLETTRQPLDEFLGAGDARRRSDLLGRRVRLGGGNVVAHRSAEQEVVLQDDADALAQMDEIDLPAVEAVDAHQPLLDRIEALDQPRDRRLAGAALADDAEDRTGRNAEARRRRAPARRPGP